MTSTVDVRVNPSTTRVEWAVYELENNTPVGNPSIFDSRSKARTERKNFEKDFNRSFGVFRRLVTETRD